MSRTTLRTFLAVFAVAIVAAVPAIASAHKGHHSHKAQTPQTVGTIVSYTDGTLVVSSGGLPVTGKVTPRTQIKFADNGHHFGWFKKHRRHGHRHGFRGHSAHFGHGHGHDWTAGGMPTGGGLPTGGDAHRRRPPDVRRPSPRDDGRPEARHRPHQGEPQAHARRSRLGRAEAGPSGDAGDLAAKDSGGHFPPTVREAVH